MTVETQEIQETESTVELQEVDVNVVDEQPAAVETPNILRTRRDGCWEVYEGAWGSYLRPTDDPDANVVVDEENLKQFQLKENIHKIPSHLWTRWVKLCFHFVDKVTSSVEVSIRILRSEEDPSQYRFLVPRQKVSGATVRVDTFDESIDIETGEEFTQYPPVGWIPVGSSHSHNTMSAFFSGVDDQYELDDPGIHLVVGSINSSKMTYSIAASVVGSRRRFIIAYTDLVDATWDLDASFHEKILDYVDYITPATYVSRYPTTWKKKETPYDYSKKEPDAYTQWWMNNGGWSDNYGDAYADPHYWSDGYVANTPPTKEEDTLKLWHIEDLIRSYMDDNKDDILKMIDLAESLKEFVSDLEVGVEIMCAT